MKWWLSLDDAVVNMFSATMDVAIKSEPVTTANVDSNKGPDFWKERLEMWKKIWEDTLDAKE